MFTDDVCTVESFTSLTGLVLILIKAFIKCICNLIAELFYDVSLSALDNSLHTAHIKVCCRLPVDIFELGHFFSAIRY